MDRERNGGSAQPRAGAAVASQSGEGVLAAPGAARRGQARCPLAAYQIQSSWSNRPWHIPLPRGREEEHKPRGDAAGEERGERGRLEPCPECLPAPITQPGNPSTSLAGYAGPSPSFHPSSLQKEPKEDQDKDLTPKVINYLLTN